MLMLCFMQAGSDSLLTSATFLKLTNSFFGGLSGLGKYKDVLYGYGVDGLVGGSEVIHVGSTASQNNNGNDATC